MEVHGFGENKCKHEVYTKDDYYIVGGSLTIGSSATDGVYTGSGSVTLPEDFTTSNCVVISKQYGTGEVANNTPDNKTFMECSLLKNVNDGTTKLSITINTEISAHAGKKLAIRIVLMKVR